MSIPLITNVAPEAGTIAAVGASSRFSVRDADSEINRDSLQLYVGSGPVFYRGSVLPEELETPTLSLKALSGSPHVFALREILGDGFLRINKNIAFQNQEAVYFMGGLEAPAAPEAPLMVEFTLRLNKSEATVDIDGFTGVMVGLLTNNSGLTVKFFSQAGVQKIEIHSAELTAWSPPSASYISDFDWDEAVALGGDGSNTYKLLWHPEQDLVRLYVKDPSANSDRILVSGSVTDFPTVPPSEQRENQPWVFFGHGNALEQVSISEWRDVHLFDTVTNPIYNGIFRGGHASKIFSNEQILFDGETLPAEAESAWMRLPDSFGDQGGGEWVSSEGLVLEKTRTEESLGYYRVEPKIVANHTILDFRLSGEVIQNDPSSESTGMEIFLDDGSKQARIAFLQLLDGTQYVGLLIDASDLGSLSSYKWSQQGFSAERNYRVVFTPGTGVTLYMLSQEDEGVEEVTTLSESYTSLPSSGMPGPGIGFLHNAHSSNALARMILRQIRYSVGVEEVLYFDDADAGWVPVGTGDAEDSDSYVRITDSSSSDYIYVEKQFIGALNEGAGWALEFRARVVSYEHDPDLTLYPAAGENPIRASTGFAVKVLDGTNQVALVFAEAGSPYNKIVFLAMYNELHENLIAIRAGDSAVSGTYYSVDWTKFHLYRLVRNIGGKLQLFIDEARKPALEFDERNFSYLTHPGGFARVQLGSFEVGIKTSYDFQFLKLNLSDGFDVASVPVLSEEELFSRFSHGINVIAEALNTLIVVFSGAAGLFDTSPEAYEDIEDGWSDTGELILDFSGAAAGFD